MYVQGREPFVRMQMWLNDPTSVDKLGAIKKLQDETRKRKRTFDESYNSGKSSPSSISDLYSNPGYPGVSPPPQDLVDGAKKMRLGCGPEGGLDLSFKRDDDDDIAAPVDAEEQADEGSEEAKPRRRKPLAPQWLAPGWGEEDHQEGGQQEEAGGRDPAGWIEDEDKESRTINGVCVVNAGAFSNGDTEN